MKKQISSLVLCLVVLISFYPPTGLVQAQAISSPVLSPITDTPTSLILDWTETTFHIQANRTYYEVRSWLDDPNYSTGNYYPENSTVTVPLSNYPSAGEYSVAVRAIEQSIELTPQGEENITQTIKSGWSNVETFTILPIPVDPSNNWKGANWEKEIITPGLHKVTIYSKNIHFLDTTTNTWLKVDFRDKGTYYLARNSEIGVRFRNAYTEIFNVAENTTKVGAERWRIQALTGGTWTFVNLTNTERSFVYTDGWVNLTRTQDIEYNSNIYGEMRTTLSLGTGIAKYTINIETTRDALIRLAWEFGTIEATTIKYLLNSEDIADKLINASRITFYDETKFTLKMDWIDAIDKFQYCRVFKQGTDVIARAFFGNWTITSGSTIELDPSLTTVTTPVEEVTVSWMYAPPSSSKTNQISLMKFDISSLSGTLSSANFVYWGLKADSAGRFNGNATISRINNQTWIDTSDDVSLADMFLNQVTNSFNITGLIGFDPISGYPTPAENTVGITNLLDQDFGSNSNFTIVFEDPDNQFPDSYGDTTNISSTSAGYSQGWGYRKTGGQNQASDYCYIYDSIYSVYFHAKLEVYIEAEGISSDTGVTVNLSIQPTDIVPSVITGYFRDVDGSYEYLNQFGFHPMLLNDGEVAHSLSRDGGQVDNAFEFHSSYWQYAQYLNYDIQGSSDDTAETINLYSYTTGGADYLVEYLSADNPTINGTYIIPVGSWFQGRYQVKIRMYGGTTINRIYTDQLAINFTAHTETRTTERILYDNALYEHFEWTALDYNDTLTVTNIPTTYTFAKMEGLGDYTDTISSDGTLIITNTTKQTYKIFFDTGATLHKVHFAQSYPDGLGSLGTWDEVRWFLNDSQLEHNDYEVFSGYYELTVYDYFGQEIASDTFTLATSDTYLQRYEIELPLYFGIFHNGDVAPYRLEITRNNILRKYPMAPKGGTELRLYGLSVNVEYYVEIYNAENNQRMDAYPLPVGANPFAIYANYDSDENIDFPPYNWIEKDLKTISTQVTGVVQVVILMGVGLGLIVLVQTKGILRNILDKPIARKGDKK